MMSTDTTEEELDKLSEEYFHDYESIRERGHISMFDVEAISQAAGIPRSVVVDIQRRYRTYQDAFGRQEIGRNALEELQMRGCVTAHYADLDVLYGDALTHRGSHSYPSALWIIQTRYGLAVIYNYETSKDQFGHKKAKPHKLEFVTQWYVSSDSERAYTEVSQEVHDYVMQQKYLKLFTNK